MTCGTYYTLFLDSTECTQGQVTQSMLNKESLQNYYSILNHIDGPKEKKIKEKVDRGLTSISAVLGHLELVTFSR